MIDVAVEVLSNEAQKIQDEFYIDVVKAKTKDSRTVWYIKYLGNNLSRNGETVCFYCISEIEEYLIYLKDLKTMCNGAFKRNETSIFKKLYETKFNELI